MIRGETEEEREGVLHLPLESVVDARAVHFRRKITVSHGCDRVDKLFKGHPVPELMRCSGEEVEDIDGPVIVNLSVSRRGDREVPKERATKEQTRCERRHGSLIHSTHAVS